jgi:hypothetical protein
MALWVEKRASDQTDSAFGPVVVEQARKRLDGR